MVFLSPKYVPKPAALSLAAVKKPSLTRKSDSNWTNDIKGDKCSRPIREQLLYPLFMLENVKVTRFLQFFSLHFPLIYMKIHIISVRYDILSVTIDTFTVSYIYFIRKYSNIYVSLLKMLPCFGLLR